MSDLKELEINGVVYTLKDEVARNAVGSPLTANTSSDMEDTTKVYVYTGTTSGSYTNGHWYYYDGDSWEDGGVYNSQGIGYGSVNGSRLSADIRLSLMQFADKLLQIAENVAYADENGQDYYDDLEDAADALETALNPPANLESISAVFTQGQAVIYETDSLDTLKQYLVVTAHYDDESTATVTTYTLSGTLATGTSTITVTYAEKTTTFDVTVSASTVPPTGYTAYDYVYNNTASGTQQLLDTQLSGTYCGANYEHELTFVLTNNAASTSYPLYGLRSTTGSDPKARALWTKYESSTNKLACNYYGVDTGFTFTFNTNTKYKSVTSNQQWLINDVLVRDNMYTADWAAYTSGYIRLWGIQTGSTAEGGYTRHTMRVYGFKVKDLTTGNYVANMIPCTNENNVAGLYDTVRRIFCTANTASLLSAGNDS